MAAVASTTTATIAAADSYEFAAKGAIPAEMHISFIPDEWGASPGRYRTSGLYLIRWGSRASAPRRFFRSAS
jgi:hypothetical protein